MRFAGNGRRFLLLLSAPLMVLICFGLPALTVSQMDVWYGQWWKEYLQSEAGNAWFYQWNKPMQAKFNELAAMVESQGESEHPFRILMVGDSTMKHQFGAVCGFLGEHEGRRFDPAVKQSNPGCCIDTAEGGGRGLCFDFSYYRFLNPARTLKLDVDAMYFGCGLHLLHMTYGDKRLEPLRMQEWLAFEDLLEDQVKALRQKNGDNVRIIYTTTHTVRDTTFVTDFKTTLDAWRQEPGNGTIRELCESQAHATATNDKPYDGFHYWEGNIDLSGYTKEGHGEFTVETYCAEGLLDGRGSVQLNRRAKPVMAKLGVPIVDAGKITQGQAWATKRGDGRHFHPLVPIELITFLDLLVSRPPPRLVRAEETSEHAPGMSIEGQH